MMPTKYCERLKLPVVGDKNIEFFTNNTLSIANGYERVIFDQKKPFIEFSPEQINQENIHIPDQQKWRLTNSKSTYSEYRSKDYCNVKIIKFKKNIAEFKENFFYISPFDLQSDVIPILIQPLRRKNTLLGV